MTHDNQKRRLLATLLLASMIASGCSAPRSATKPVGFPEMWRHAAKDAWLVPYGAPCQCRLDELSVTPEGIMELQVTLANVSETDLVVLENMMQYSAAMAVKLWPRGSDALYVIDGNPYVMPAFGLRTTVLRAGERRTLKCWNDALSQRTPANDRSTRLVRYSSTELGLEEGTVVTQLPKGLYVVETEMTLGVLREGDDDSEDGRVARNSIYVPTRNKLWYEVK